MPIRAIIPLPVASNKLNGVFYNFFCGQLQFYPMFCAHPERYLGGKNGLNIFQHVDL
jgi:hypothetical protein